MRAAICTAYGPPEVLQVQEVPNPAPRAGEVRIKIFATTVTASDVIVRGLRLPVWQPMGFMMRLFLGFSRPRNPILGMVAAGQVDSLGKGAGRFHEGDQVYSFNIRRFGTYAEYLCLPQDEVIAPKPSNLTFDEAAAIPYGGLLALHYLRKAGIRSGQDILIYGASGAVGTSAVELARHFGARVTAMCSPANFELVKSLGAGTALDYTTQDVANRPERHDLVFDAVGKRKSAGFRGRQVLTPDGKFISVDDGSPNLRVEGLVFLKDLVEAGQLKPVIDRRYRLDQIVEAHAYVDQGHKKGNVVIKVQEAA